jgi:flagellar secretion chaperone FliS
MYRPASARSANAYRTIGVETTMHTVDQYQIVCLLFEGILESIATARGAMARKDVLAKCNAITRALRILTEGLQTSLDKEEGGELARNLSALYEYCSQRLLYANVNNDDAALQEVARLIAPVADGWKAIRQQRSEA